MRSLALIFIALVLVSTLAIKAKKPTASTLKKIEKLTQNRKSWSAIFIKMALLHAKAGGPVDELIAGIEKVVNDLETKLEEAQSAFDQRTGEHNTEVKRLNREIDNANSDAAHTQQFLNEVLYVTKEDLEEAIVEYQENIVQSRQFLNDIGIQRDAEHEDFTEKVEDFETGVAACQEAFGILEELLESGESLAQVSKAKNQLVKLTKKFSKSVDQAMVKALLQVASTGADQGMVRKILDAIHDVADNLREALEKLNADEEQAQEDYEELVADTEREIRGFEAGVITSQGELEATERKIENNEAFLAQRQADVVDFTQQLEDEDASFEHDTQVFNDLVEEFQHEEEACNEALEVLRSAEFAGYIGDRMSQSGPVIDTHASAGQSGITVN